MASNYKNFLLTQLKSNQVFLTDRHFSPRSIRDPGSFHLSSRAPPNSSALGQQMENKQESHTRVVFPGQLGGDDCCSVYIQLAEFSHNSTLNCKGNVFLADEETGSVSSSKCLPSGPTSGLLHCSPRNKHSIDDFPPPPSNIKHVSVLI